MKSGHWIFKTKFLLGCILILLPLNIHAQLKCNLTSYTTKDGLSHDGVLCITRDHEGFMWIGTFDGLNRFDGHNFVVYKSRPGDRSSLRSNKIRHIVEDKAGYLWIQTFDYKIYRFDKKTEQFLAVTDGPYKSLFEGQVTVDKVIADSISGVWLLTKEQGLYHTYCNALGTPIVHQYTPHQSIAHQIKGYKVRFQCTDAKGRIWIGTEAGLNCLQQKDGINYQTVKFEAGIAQLLLVYSFTAVAKNADNLYFGTEDGHLLIYNLLTNKFTVQNISNGARINNICISQIGALYISTTGKGLLKFDPKGLTIVPSLVASNASYFSLYEDKADNIWIEPEDAGIIKYNPHTGIYKHFTQKKGFHQRKPRVSCSYRCQ
jgi:ligand-binding sensor domain-containing protein